MMIAGEGLHPVLVVGRMDGKSFRLADEVRHTQRRAAVYDGRIVTIGQLVLFSTKMLPS
jgi:hypothetical protein